LLGVVDVDTVRRRIDDVVASRAEVDARVSARQVALAVGQDPVALERAPIVPPFWPNSIAARSPGLGGDD
jgi:hypothetical protein